MKYRLRPVKEQVIVITGASSGIGLATAQLAAARGAKVVLNSRDEADLRTAAEGIRAVGGEAIYVVADVADYDAVRVVADRAVRAFGGIDTWVNNAGVSIMGLIEDVPLAAAERLFRTNYFGVVNGCLVALPHLKQRALAAGGRRATALINVGSALSDTAYPLQGHYAASKHAVKGFTDTLRIELEKQGAPVVVTLIQPAAINTPYPEHAENYLGVEPTHVPPVYAPEVAARAILACAERPQRDVRVGGSAEMFALTEAFAARAGDRLKEATAFEGQRTDRPPRDTGILFAPRAGDGRVNGNYEGHVMRSSAYTKAEMNGRQLLLGAAVLGAGAWLTRRAGRGADDGGAGAQGAGVHDLGAPHEQGRQPGGQP